MESGTDDAAVDQLLEQLVQQVEVDSGFDVEAFLSRHPLHAAEVRTRLARLQRIGVLKRGVPEGKAIRHLRDRYGVDLAPRGLGHENAQPRASDVPTDRGESNRDPILPVDVEVGDRYRVLGVLGSGGMGRVLRAVDIELGREVAIKVIRAPQLLETRSPQAVLRLARFVHEAQTTGQLEHPNIVPVYDFGLTAEGEPYFTMKIVRGRTLLDVIQSLAHGDQEARAKFSLRRRVEVVQRICDGMAFAHARGIVHRDLKPSNVMIGDFGEVQVMDWGLARRFESELDERARPRPFAASGAPGDEILHTQPGDRLGSPAYMSPEQAQGRVESIDARSDVFGVGAILYHLLSGRPPYDGKDREEVLQHASEGTLDDPDMRRATPAVPRELVAVCRKAMSVNPLDRHPTVQALAQDLAAFLEDRSGSAWKDRPLSRLKKVIRRHPLATAATGSLLVIGLLGLLLASQMQRLRDQDLDLLVGRTRADTPTLRDNDVSKILNSSNADYGGWCEEFLEKLKGIDPRLDLQVAQDTFLPTYSRIRERSPETALDLRMELYQFAHILYLTGAFHLWQESVGQVPVINPTLTPANRADTLARRAATARDRPGLVQLWPRLCSILEAIEEDPWRREAWHARIAWITSATDRFDPVIEGSGSRSSRDLTWLATLVRSARGQPAALPILERASERDSALYDVQFELARAYGHSERDPESIEKAIGHGEIAVALKPGSAWAWTNLGKAHIDLAVLFNTDLRERLSRDPGDEHAAWLTAQVEHEKAQAITCYRRAIEINPNVAGAHNNLANAVANPVERVFHLQQALRAEPRNPLALSNYAFHLLFLGCDAEAMPLWTRLASVRQLAPDELQGLGKSATARAREELIANSAETSKVYLEISLDALQRSADRSPEWFVGVVETASLLVELDHVERALDWLDWLLADSTAGVETDHRTEEVLPVLVAAHSALAALRSPPEGAPWATRARTIMAEIDRLAGMRSSQR